MAAMETGTVSGEACDASPLGHLELELTCDGCGRMTRAFHDEWWHIWSPTDGHWFRFCRSPCFKRDSLPLAAAHHRLAWGG
jgi:hypothetical protein